MTSSNDDEQRRWAHDQAKWEYEQKRTLAERVHARADAAFDNLNGAAIKDAQAVLRSLVVINGGAAVAILAFLGGLASAERVLLTDLGLITGSLILFGLGVFAAVVGMALAYFTNGGYAATVDAHERVWQHPYLKDTPQSERRRRWGRVFHSLAVVAVFASLSLFLWGVVDVQSSVGQLGA